MQNITWLVGCDVFLQYCMLNRSSVKQMSYCSLWHEFSTATWLYLFFLLLFFQIKYFWIFLSWHIETHTRMLLALQLLYPTLPKQGVVYHLSSPCTPLWGQGPAPASPGVKEGLNDALLMTCQKERALHAATYFTATLSAGHYHPSLYMSGFIEYACC